jgi:spore germination protein GerM
MTRPLKRPSGPQPMLWFSMIAMAVLLLALGVLFALQQTGTEPLPISDKPITPIKITAPTRTGERPVELYFMDRQEPLLVRETRWIPEGESLESLVRYAVAALAGGTTDELLISPLPENTRLLGSFYQPEYKRMILDMSLECVEQQPGDTFSEWATIFALTNTVAGLSPDIQEVLLLCEGKPIKDTPGNWDWSLPYKPDNTFVRYRPSTASDS